MSDNDLVDQVKSITIRQVALGPLQQLVYTVTEEEVKCKGVFALIWGITGGWFLLNSIGIPAVMLLFCGLAELATRHDFDRLDDLRDEFDPDYFSQEPEDSRRLESAANEMDDVEYDKHLQKSLSKRLQASEDDFRSMSSARDTMAAVMDSRLKTKHNSDIEVIRSFSNQRQNVLVVATGGAGKGMFLANVARMKKGYTFWIDPKGEKDETGYFNHQNIICYRFRAEECTPVEIVQHMQSALNEYRDFCNQLERKASVNLIFDEWYFIQTTLSRTDKRALANIESMIISAVSLCDGKNKHITLVVQSPKVDDILKGSGGALANFSTVALFKAEDRSYKMLDKAVQCGVIRNEFNSESKLFDICHKSPVNRAIYINGAITPMPRLDNYSSYDRDSGEYLEVDTVQDVTDLANPISTKAESVSPNSSYSEKVQKLSDMLAEFVADHLAKNDLEWETIGRVINLFTPLKKLPSGDKRNKLAKIASELAAEQGRLRIKHENNSFSLGLPIEEDNEFLELLDGI